MQADACEGTFAQADACTECSRAGIVAGTSAYELAEEAGDVGIVADYENIFRGSAIAEKVLKLCVGRGGE